MSKWQESGSPSAPSAPVAESAPVDKPIHEHHAEGEYETSHIRKREIKFSEAFFEPHVEKACGVCHEMYGIHKDDCEHAKNKAKVNCFRKAKAERDNFMAKMSESGSTKEEAGEESADSGRESSKEKPSDDALYLDWGYYFSHPNSYPQKNLRLGSEDEFFTETYLRRTCKICADVGGVNHDNCIADTENARSYCRMTIKEMRPKFNAEWDKGPSNEPEAPPPAPAAEIPVTTEDLFKPEPIEKNEEKDDSDDAINVITGKFMEAWMENPLIKREIQSEEAFFEPHVVKTCGVCHELYGIDKDEGEHARNKAKVNCFRKAKADRDNFMAKMSESGSTSQQAGPYDPNNNPERASASIDYFNPENLAKTCKICHDIAQVDEQECKADDDIERLSCRTAVEQRKTRFEAAWASSGGPSEDTSSVSPGGSSEGSSSVSPGCSSEGSSSGSPSGLPGVSSEGSSESSPNFSTEGSSSVSPGGSSEGSSSVSPDGSSKDSSSGSPSGSSSLSPVGSSSGSPSGTLGGPSEGNDGHWWPPFWILESIRRFFRAPLKSDADSNRSTSAVLISFSPVIHIDIPPSFPLSNMDATTETLMKTKLPSALTTVPAPIPRPGLLPTPDFSKRLMVILDTNCFLQDDINLMENIKAALFRKCGYKGQVCITWMLNHEIDGIKGDRSGKREDERKKAIVADRLLTKWLENNDICVRWEDSVVTVSAYRNGTLMLPIINRDDTFIAYGIWLKSLTDANKIAILSEDYGMRRSSFMVGLAAYDVATFVTWLSSPATTFW